MPRYARRDRPRTGWWAPEYAPTIDPVGCDATSPRAGDDHRTELPWPGHDLATIGCTDYVIGTDIGELAPGYYYSWTPGLTASMGEGSRVWLTVEYGADELPEDLDCAGSYDADGGEFSEGEIGYARPPTGARHVWFDFYATTDEDRRACRLTIDLATKRVQVER